MLQDQIQGAAEERSRRHPDAIFGPDLIGDFHRVVIAELQVWAVEASKELAHLRGRHLAARRAELRKLRAEIRAICAEIEERETSWAERTPLLRPVQATIWPLRQAWFSLSAGEAPLPPPRYEHPR